MRYLIVLLMMAGIAWATPNGYFQANSDGTIDVIASGAIVDDVTASSNITAQSLQLSGGTGTQGTFTWNDDEETVDLVQNGAVLQLGQEQQTHCKNATGVDIPNGTVVVAAGTDGASGNIKIAPFNYTNDIKYIVGVTTEVIENDTFGKVTTFGKVRGYDTSVFNEADLLWPSDTVDGALTNVAPTNFNITPLAIAVNSKSHGTIFVRFIPTQDGAATAPFKVNNLEYTATNLYNDLRFPAANISAPGIPNAPAEIISNTCIPVLQFTQNDIVYFNAQMDHSYWNGTTLRPHIHIISDGSETTNVWEFTYSKAEIGETYSAPITLTFTNITSTTAGEHLLTNAGDMNGFTNGVSGMAGCSLKLISDTTADLTEIDIHYRVKYGARPYNP